MHRSLRSLFAPCFKWACDNGALTLLAAGACGAAGFCQAQALPVVEYGKPTVTVRGSVEKITYEPRQPSPLIDGDLLGILALSAQRWQNLQPAPERPIEPEPAAEALAGPVSPKVEHSDTALKKPASRMGRPGSRGGSGFLLRPKPETSSEADPEPVALASPSPVVTVGKIVDVDPQRSFCVAWLPTRRLWLQGTYITRGGDLRPTAVLTASGHKAARAQALELVWGSVNVGDSLCLPDAALTQWVEQVLADDRERPTSSAD
jgi:hypothetical protein